MVIGKVRTGNGYGRTGPLVSGGRVDYTDRSTRFRTTVRVDSAQQCGLILSLRTSALHKFTYRLLTYSPLKLGRYFNERVLEINMISHKLEYVIGCAEPVIQIILLTMLPVDR